MRSLLVRRNIFLFLGGFFLSFLVVFSILVYFFKIDKGPEKINFVFLGESGPGHGGPQLTDTIIFASFTKNGTVLVSVPRDLWYQPWQTKVNSLYFYGQEKGDGLELTKQILGEILGQKIDHVFLIDFVVFQDLVDLVGGVDVMVERSFDDFRYPIAGREDDLCDGDPTFACRYEHIRFETGPSHLDGEQALKFVRSRNAEGEEGTDTARDARQQKVVLALKNKLASPTFFLSVKKIKALKEIYEERVKSDTQREDLVNLGKILLSSSARNFQSFVINDWQKEEGLIYHPQKHSSGQWVLLPKDPTWNQIHQFVACLLSQSDKSSCFPEKKPPPLNL